MMQIANLLRNWNGPDIAHRNLFLMKILMRKRFALSSSFDWNFLIFSSTAIKYYSLLDYFSHEFFYSPSVLVFVLKVFMLFSQKLWSFHSETFRFVDKRIQCLQQKEKKGNLRKTWILRSHKRKLERRRPWVNTLHLSSGRQLIPVCVRDCDGKQKILQRVKQSSTIKTINQSRFWQLSIFFYRRKIIYGMLAWNMDLVSWDLPLESSIKLNQM